MTTAVQTGPIQFVPSESQLAVAYSVCRGITRAAARNFYYAFLVLPKPKRQALSAVYAFMRRCDDISDDPALPCHERRQKLAEWIDALHDVQAGQATDDPVLLALTDAQRRYDIPAGLLDQLASGTAMDLKQQPEQSDGAKLPAVQYATFDDLYVYCYRVASVVGLVCIRVFGYSDPAAEALAERLGIAFQLTNIIRDVKEDAAMGRIYFPLEDLTRFDIPPADFENPSAAARLHPLLAFEADRTRDYYKAAGQLIPLIDEDSQPALWVLATIYQHLLEKIARSRYDVFRKKIRLTVWEKLSILAKGAIQRLA